MTSSRPHWLLAHFALAVAGTALSCGGVTEGGSTGGGGGAGSWTGGAGGVQSSGGAFSGGSGGASSGGSAGTLVGGSGGDSGGVGGSGMGGLGGTTAPAICNGVQCPVDQDCCLTDSKCFDPKASPGACVAPTQAGPQGQKPCGASSQCAPDEYCQPLNEALCLGPGYCASKTNCPGSYTGGFCGCNGVTYPNVQTACAAGVAVVGWAVCGEPVTVGAAGASAGKKVTYCALDTQCASGAKCCGITGLCYDPSKAALCSFPPPGTTVPCLDDTQCIQGVEYCSGQGCTDPGGCADIPGSGSCTGELTPVCGCNGKSYANAGCAAAAGVRVAHAGQCP